jgi:hypothetical protein
METGNTPETKRTLVLGSTGKTGPRLCDAHLTYGLRRVLGREPRDFADYAREAAATGVWAGA